ncbi:TPA: endonuclease III, partial [Candidatus Kaiserbacteria bacterium]|nr:endonuclease III [Candidatus Kaiserbacteria bacterium]
MSVRRGEKIVEKYNGKVPHLYNELVELPGVGDYTAKAVRVFAWNKPEILIETNIRTAFIYHFF